jgi:hypothetical protein
VRRSLKLVVVAGVAAGALVLPQVGSAAPAAHASKAITLTCKTPLKGQSVSGTCTGSFGRIRSTGTLAKDFKSASVTMHLKGGTARMKYNVVGGSATFSGNWRWTGGTGKYKKIRGSGTVRGDFKGNVRYTGTARW